MEKVLFILSGLTLLASASLAQNVTVAGSTGADGSYVTLPRPDLVPVLC